ncbi:hypothetical protein [Actinomadura sp. 3N407]|uniref:hypothetical protein n=1 Tax=Actinomadura sp. 3N407 TaxID=3457423 RepID=UPI003FCE5AF3
MPLGFAGDLARECLFRGVHVTTPEKAAEAEHWVRHRTDIEALNRDAKHGVALRHLTSGHPEVSAMWMWASLLACAMSAWLQEICGLDHGNGRGRATITRLRRELIAVPAWGCACHPGTISWSGSWTASPPCPIPPDPPSPVPTSANTPRTAEPPPTRRDRRAPAQPTPRTRPRNTDQPRTPTKSNS